MPWAKSVYWLYSVLVDKALRDKIIQYLEERGIEIRPFFYPIHILPPYKKKIKLPVAEELSAAGLNLPSGFRLSVNQIQEAVELLSESLEKLT